MPYLAPTDLHPKYRQAIKDLPELEEVIMFFDGDQAGEKAVIRVSEKLQEIRPGIKVTVVRYAERTKT